MKLIENNGILGLVAKGILIFTSGQGIPFVKSMIKNGKKIVENELSDYDIESQGDSFATLKFYNDKTFCKVSIEESDDYISIKLTSDSDFLEIALHTNESDTVYFEDVSVNGKIFIKNNVEKTVLAEKKIFGKTISTGECDVFYQKRLPTQLTNSDGYYVTFLNEPRKIDAEDEICLVIQTMNGEDEILYSIY